MSRLRSLALFAALAGALALMTTAADARGGHGKGHAATKHHKPWFMLR